MKTNKNFIYILLMLLSVSITFNSTMVMADDDDDEGIEDTTETLSENENSSASNIKDNEKGLENAGDMYKLDNITAENFQKISNIERENTLIKLKIEQEKLKLEFERQEVEKRKLKSNEKDEERQRKIKAEEQERKLAQEKKRTEDENRRQEEERKVREEKENLNRELMEKIKSANMSNSKDVKQLTALLATMSGKQLSDLGSFRVSGDNTSEERPEAFEDKYKLRSIIGSGGELTANVENLKRNTTFKVKKDSLIDEWLVIDIRGSSIVLKSGTKTKVLSIN